MNKQDVVNIILEGKDSSITKDFGIASAPSNIALAKYWGKRNEEIILPYTSSLSVPLGNLGTETKISLSVKDEIYLNNKPMPLDNKFSKRILGFLELVRDKDTYFKIETKNSIPTGAGVASSASGGAALVVACNDLFNWQLEDKDLSILARLVSGSACRSVYKNKFALWNKGEREDGVDSYAIALDKTMKELCIGLVLISEEEKKHSSRSTMKEVLTSPHYEAWIKDSDRDIEVLKQAINTDDFRLLGETAEDNAMRMHKIIQTQKNPVNYFTEGTLNVIDKVKSLRKNGLDIYCTIDAGSNVKLLFEDKNTQAVKEEFTNLKLVCPFG